MAKKYDKLVRDNIPSIIVSDGKRCTYRKVEGEELKTYLHKKIDEEVAELHNAKTPKEVCEEIIDIIDVLQRLAGEEGITDELLHEVSDAKDVNGRFEEGYVLEEVEEVE